MGIRLYNKIRQQGVVWCVNRLIRECWHPRLPFVKFISPFSKKIFIVFSRIGRAIDLIRGKKKGIASQTLYLFYDFEVCPISFDFCWSLAMAEFERAKKSLSAIHVIFVSGNQAGLRVEDPAYEKIMDHNARSWRVTNLLLPMIGLLPGQVGVTLCGSREEATFFMQKAKHSLPNFYSVTVPNYTTLSDAMKLRKDLRVLSTNKHSLATVEKWLSTFINGRKLISITLRDYNYMVARNSDTQEWLKFLRTLNTEEYAIVIVPDTDTAMPNQISTFQSFVTCIPASWNVQLRMALYEQSYLNLGVNTGPMALCWLNKKCRYITFKLKAPQVPHTSDSTMEWLGFSLHQSLPFASKFQKWVWEADKADVIAREFKLMCDKISDSGLRTHLENFKKAG